MATAAGNVSMIRHNYHQDSELEDFLKSNVLKEQVELINKLGQYITVLQRVGRGLGEQEFDRQLLQQKCLAGLSGALSGSIPKY
ncbi:hypothetical protein RvY_03532 [Ramazzottius varieornatus]|uniref:Uncharacterized protein n=1 Tax=Ramazzottius varieornatus TaxID=947166 RepID=A0A1D1UU38_RAMVA|nr:hypothetical protein RvY_03532 [Ramazzottius varieornatus]